MSFSYRKEACTKPGIASEMSGKAPLSILIFVAAEGPVGDNVHSGSREMLLKEESQEEPLDSSTRNPKRLPFLEPEYIP